MAYRQIFLKDNDSAIKKEALASGTVKPGFLLERTSATADTVKAHAQSGRKTGPTLVALEDEIQGNGVADSYLTTTRVFFKALKPGDEVVLRAANGQNIAKGDLVASNGNGYVRKALKDSSDTLVEDSIVGVALEAKDMSDSSAADPDDLFLVEIA